MADCKHAAVKGMQPARLEPVIDGVGTESQLKELQTRGHAILLFRQSRQRYLIRSNPTLTGIWTVNVALAGHGPRLPSSVLPIYTPV